MCTSREYGPCMHLYTHIIIICIATDYYIIVHVLCMLVTFIAISLSVSMSMTRIVFAPVPLRINSTTYILLRKKRWIPHVSHAVTKTLYGNENLECVFVTGLHEESTKKISS